MGFCSSDKHEKKLWRGHKVESKMCVLCRKARSCSTKSWTSMTSFEMGIWIEGQGRTDPAHGSVHVHHWYSNCHAQRWCRRDRFCTWFSPRAPLAYYSNRHAQRWCQRDATDECILKK